MLLPYGSLRLRPRVLLLTAAVFATTLWTLLLVDREPAPSSPDAQTLERDYPLTWKHVQSFNGTGGGALTLHSRHAFTLCPRLC